MATGFASAADPALEGVLALAGALARRGVSERVLAAVEHARVSTTNAQCVGCGSLSQDLVVAVCRASRASSGCLVEAAGVEAGDVVGKCARFQSISARGCPLPIRAR